MNWLLSIDGPRLRRARQSEPVHMNESALTYRHTVDLLDAARRLGLGPLAFTHAELEPFTRLRQGRTPTTLLDEPIVAVPSWPWDLLT